MQEKVQKLSRERGSEGGRDGGREGGRDGEREEGRDGERDWRGDLFGKDSLLSVGLRNHLALLRLYTCHLYCHVTQMPFVLLVCMRECRPCALVHVITHVDLFFGKYAVCRRVTWLIHECAFIRVTWLSHVCDMTHWHMWRERLVARYHLSTVMSQVSSHLSSLISHLSSLMMHDGAIRVAECEMSQDGGLKQSGHYCRERKVAPWASHSASHSASCEAGASIQKKASAQGARFFPFYIFSYFCNFVYIEWPPTSLRV